MQDNTTFSRPPVIILVSEDNDGAFNAIIANKDRLYELGYRGINLEYNCNVDHQYVLNQCQEIEKAKNTVMQQPVKKAIDEEAMRWFKGLKSYYHANGTFNLIKEFQADGRWNISFIDIEKEEMFTNDNCLTLRQPLEKLKPMREVKFAQEITKSSREYNGGTITIIGNNHNTVSNDLKKISPGITDSILFLAIEKYHPVKFPIAQKVLDEIEQKRLSSYQRNIETRRISLPQFFQKDSFYSLSITREEHSNIVNALFLKYIETKIKQLENSADAEKTISLKH